MKRTSSPFLLLALVLNSSVTAADSGQIELAHKVVEATQYNTIIDQMVTQVEMSTVQLSPLSKPNLPPTLKEAAAKMMDEAADVSMEAAKELTQNAETVYSEVFSESELKAMLAFFESPEGKSMLQKQPQIMVRMMPLIQNMRGQLTPKIQQIVEKAQTAAGIKTPMTPAAKALMPGQPMPLPTPSPTSGPVPIPHKSSGPTPIPRPTPPSDVSAK